EHARVAGARRGNEREVQQGLGRDRAPVPEQMAEPGRREGGDRHVPSLWRLVHRGASRPGNRRQAGGPAQWIRREFTAHATRSYIVQLAILTIDDAPAESRAVLDGIAADLGLVPNLAAATAASPALLAGFDGLRRAVASAKLDPVLREIAGVVVGVAVDNRYGVAFHSTMLAKLGLPGEQVKLLREGAAPADRTAAAVAALARDIALN